MYGRVKRNALRRDDEVGMCFVGRQLLVRAATGGRLFVLGYLEEAANLIQDETGAWGVGAKNLSPSRVEKMCALSAHFILCQ